MKQKTQYLLYFFLFTSQLLCGQVNPNSYLERYNDTPETARIATELTKDIEDDSMKVLRIYEWIVKNINYDSVRASQLGINNIVNYGNAEIIDYNKIKSPHTCSDILKQRKTVCIGYAYLFVGMCSSLNIPCEVIKGFGRSGEEIVKFPNHAWVAFKISNNWYLADPTWDSNIFAMGLQNLRRFSFTFLMQEPAEFIKTHLPLDPLWQLNKNIINFENWYNHKYDSLGINNSEIFIYQDSLSKYEKSSTEIRFLSSLKRISKIKEVSYMADIEYIYIYLKPLYEEIVDYLELNQRVNLGNKNIYEMAKKVLPKKKELYNRLSRIENLNKKIYFHIQNIHKFSKELSDFLGTAEILKNYNKSNKFLIEERQSLTSTIKQLESLPKYN